MAKQKFAIDVAAFDLDNLGVKLSMVDSGESRVSTAVLNMTATQLAVLAKALRTQDSDFQIITGLDGSAKKSVSPGDDETMPDRAEEPSHEERRGDRQANDDVNDETDDPEDQHAVDFTEPVVFEDENTDEVCRDVNYAEPKYADFGRENGFYGDEDEHQYEDVFSSPSYDDDPNRDIFDDPEIDLNDLEDLEQRFLAAKLRAGPAVTGGGLIVGLRQSLEAALKIGRDPSQRRPRVRGGSKNPIVRDLIRRHIRNREWE